MRPATALRPMYVELSTIERSIRACSRIATLDESTVYGPIVASGWIRQ